MLHKNSRSQSRRLFFSSPVVLVPTTRQPDHCPPRSPAVGPYLRSLPGLADVADLLAARVDAAPAHAMGWRLHLLATCDLFFDPKHSIFKRKIARGISFRDLNRLMPLSPVTIQLISRSIVRWFKPSIGSCLKSAYEHSVVNCVFPAIGSSIHPSRAMRIAEPFGRRMPAGSGSRRSCSGPQATSAPPLPPVPVRGPRGGGARDVAFPLTEAVGLACLVGG